MAQVMVDRLPADPVVTGKDGFWNTGFGTLDQLGGEMPQISRCPAAGRTDEGDLVACKAIVEAK